LHPVQRVLIQINASAGTGRFLHIATLDYYGLLSLRSTPSTLEKPGDYFGDTMAVSAKSRKTTPRMRGAVFLCLLLLSFVLPINAYAAGNASSLVAGQPHPCVSHVGLANSEVSCPHPARHHKALTCCCPTFVAHFSAIISEPAFRLLYLHAAVIPGDYLPAFGNSPSQVIHPPKLALQA